MVCQKFFDAPSLFVFTPFALSFMHIYAYVLERFWVIPAYVLEEKSLFSAYVLENIIIYTLIIQHDTEVWGAVHKITKT